MTAATCGTTTGRSAAMAIWIRLHLGRYSMLCEHYSRIRRVAQTQTSRRKILATWPHRTHFIGGGLRSQASNSYCIVAKPHILTYNSRRGGKEFTTVNRSGEGYLLECVELKDPN